MQNYDFKMSRNMINYVSFSETGSKYEFLCSFSSYVIKLSLVQVIKLVAGDAYYKMLPLKFQRVSFQFGKHNTIPSVLSVAKCFSPSPAKSVCS